MQIKEAIGVSFSGSVESSQLEDVVALVDSAAQSRERDSTVAVDYERRFPDAQAHRPDFCRGADLCEPRVLGRQAVACHALSYDEHANRSAADNGYGTTSPDATLDGLLAGFCQLITFAPRAIMLMPDRILLS
jgi:hypothetical protein